MRSFVRCVEWVFYLGEGSNRLCLGAGGSKQLGVVEGPAAGTPTAALPSCPPASLPCKCTGCPTTPHPASIFTPTCPCCSLTGAYC